MLRLPTHCPPMTLTHRPPALAFVVNPGSGQLQGHQRLQAIAERMAADGRPFHLWPLGGERPVATVVDEAVDWAVARGGAVVAAGGDGTLNAVAQRAVAAGCPMGVLPQGTFNYFARAQGIPLDPPAALDHLLAARPRPVQVGEVNGHVFLVNGSLGLYPQLLQDREAFKRQHGRNRFNALLAAVGTIMKDHRDWLLDLDLGERRLSLRTATLFVGNNPLQLQQVGLPEAEVVPHGALAAVVVRPMGRLAMMGLALRGALGNLGDDERVLNFAFRELVVVRARRAGWRRARPVRVAVDGELLRLPSPLTFRVGPRPLHLLLADAGADGVAEP